MLTGEQRQPGLHRMRDSSRRVRTALRIVFAVVVAAALFAFWTSLTGRGFLSSHRQVYWVTAKQHEDGWDFSIIGSGTEADTNPSPDGNDAIYFRINESSRGRTDPGRWSAWRRSHWTITEIAEAPDGWRFWDAALPPGDEGLHEAFTQFMEDDLVPGSDAILLWPSEPFDLRRNEGSWTATQHRTSQPLLLAIIILCGAIGTMLSLIVLPPRRSGQRKTGRVTPDGARAEPPGATREPPGGRGEPGG